MMLYTLGFTHCTLHVALYTLHFKHCKRFLNWKCLNVGTVPTYKMHNIGTVPTFNMHNVGTVPMFKMHNVGTPKNCDLYFELEFGSYGKNK